MSALSDTQILFRDLATADRYASWDEAISELGGEVKSDNIVDTTRWATISVMVFELGGHFYEVTYESPATEMQEGPEEGILYEIDSMREVKPKEVVVTKYVPVTSQ